ncbi:MULTISPECIES: hypothetical protein [Actinoalloteichus]|uniref:hypothetical protein n=1 Tax=Actinoalloteichus TaxID=65496 RepID=UPI001E6479D9|nr:MULTISPECIES: hypothetical protein [Actinoalloteichus]
MRSVCSMLAVVGFLLTMGGFTAAAASPAGEDPGTSAVSCSGTVSYSRTLSSGVGELAIFYNSSNGGTNSACFYHRGASYGVAAPTYVRAYRCVESSGEGLPCTIDTSSSADLGDFAYYAGPRGVTGTANRCVAAVGYIEWGGLRQQISSGRQGC